MGGELNEVSVAIGQLTAASEAGQRQRAELFKRIGQTNADISELKTEIAGYHGSVKALLRKHDDDITSLKNDVKGLKKFKQRALVMVAGVGGSGGMIGGGLSHLVNFFKGPN